MRVCFLIYNLEPGGLQNYLFRFLTYYRNQLEVTIIVKNGRSGQFLNSFVSIGANVHLIKSGYLNVDGWYKIFHFLKVNSFDAVCDFTGNFSGVYLLLAKWNSVEKRIAYYGQSQDHFRKTTIRKVYNFFVNGLVRKYATCIIANSKTGMDYFFPSESTVDNRFKIIPNGINPADFSTDRDNTIRRALNIPDNAFVIGNTSRYDEKKNHNTLLQLARLSSEKRDNFYYVICGYGTEAIQTRIKEMELSERVIVLGYRQDIPLLLRNFDAFYFPSFTEGLSNSLIEALLSGLPIVASNIESNKEALPQALWPYLTEPEDYAGAYAELSGIHDGSYVMKPLAMRDWAINKFQYETYYRRFFECL